MALSILGKEITKFTGIIASYHKMNLKKLSEITVRMTLQTTGIH